MAGELASILSVLKDVRDDNKRSGWSTKKRTLKMVTAPKKSISRLAMDAMANFPILLDNQCTLDEGMLAARSLEKRYASFLLVAMSMDSRFDYSGDADLSDYIKQFHQNMNVNSFDAKFSLESATVSDLAKLAESIGMEYQVFATEQTVDILHTVYEGVNSNSINREAAKLNFSITDVTEQRTVNSLGRIPQFGPVSEAVANRSGPIIDAEFKKANDSVPTLLHIVVAPKDPNDDKVTDFVVGVKATLHPVSQSDIILNLVRGLKNDDNFFNFMRWTTGEIKFVKDFLFCVDQLKMEAVASANSAGNRFFNMGRRRKELATIKNRFSKGDLMPNMTIMVTTDCLQKIKDEYGYDITPSGGASQVALVRKLMYTYFMLGFVIVDQGLTRMHIMIDGDNDFETYTYAGLEKEGNMNDRQFKEMMKMLGRGGA